MSDHLHRNLAPISEQAWGQIEDDVKPRLGAYLAARKLVDFEGPKGWEHSAKDLGRTRRIEALSPELSAAQRVVMPLVEVRADFALGRDELAALERGAQGVDLSALDSAAQALALAENRSVLHGNAAAGITGVAEASDHAPIAIARDVGACPSAVARAVDALRQAGIGGPFGLAIAPGLYTEIVETTEQGGYPLFDHLREILGGPVVWAPGVDGGVVLSLRGGDFVLECGQDISIGYASHDTERVNLYLEETFTFCVLEPDAAIALEIEST
jgi:uncharacterized linocin/CFP29 family protein